MTFKKRHALHVSFLFPIKPDFLSPFSQGTLAAACSPVLSSSVLRDTGNTLRNALLPEPAIYYILIYKY